MMSVCPCRINAMMYESTSLGHKPFVPFPSQPETSMDTASFALWLTYTPGRVFQLIKTLCRRQTLVQTEDTVWCLKGSVGRESGAQHPCPEQVTVWLWMRPLSSLCFSISSIKGEDSSSSTNVKRQSQCYKHYLSSLPHISPAGLYIYG